VRERDRGLRQVPGCSRAGGHVHHVEFRSRGGGDEEWNLVTVCAAHHLHGIHHGRLRVSGRAPDGLVCWFAGREARA
jgi:5-methylcytosine-specific restriction endonuclease McrA